MKSCLTVKFRLHFKVAKPDKVKQCLALRMVELYSKHYQYLHCDHFPLKDKFTQTWTFSHYLLPVINNWIDGDLF